MYFALTFRMNDIGKMSLVTLHKCPSGCLTYLEHPVDASLRKLLPAVVSAMSLKKITIIMQCEYTRKSLSFVLSPRVADSCFILYTNCSKVYLLSSLIFILLSDS